jgi:hypothetical protein
VTAFAHQLARLIGPLHGLFSAGLYGDDGAPLARRTGSGRLTPTTPAIPSGGGRRVQNPAAYTGGRPCSSMRGRKARHKRVSGRQKTVKPPFFETMVG